MQELDDDPLVGRVARPQLDPARLLQGDAPRRAGPVRRRRQDVEPALARERDRPRAHADIEDLAVLQPVRVAGDGHRAGPADVQDTQLAPVEEALGAGLVHVVERQRPRPRDRAAQDQPVVMRVDEVDRSVGEQPVHVEVPGGALRCRASSRCPGRWRGASRSSASGASGRKSSVRDRKAVGEPAATIGMSHRRRAVGRMPADGARRRPDRRGDRTHGIPSDLRRILAYQIRWGKTVSRRPTRCGRPRGHRSSPGPRRRPPPHPAEPARRRRAGPVRSRLTWCLAP